MSHFNHLRAAFMTEDKIGSVSYLLLVRTQKGREITIFFSASKSLEHVDPNGSFLMGLC